MIQAQLSERAIDLLALPEGEPALLLDIGCGSGLSGECISNRGYHWIGCDISRAMLDIACNVIVRLLFDIRMMSMEMLYSTTRVMDFHFEVVLLMERLVFRLYSGFVTPTQRAKILCMRVIFFSLVDVV